MSEIIAKGRKSLLWTEDYENKVIQILKVINEKEPNVNKDRQFYHIKSSFKLISLGGVTKVCRIKDNRIMTTKNHAGNIIRDLHVACGHKGEKKTYKKVAEHYANIPMFMIKRYIQQCERCTEKTKKITQAGIVVRPLITQDLNQRAQVDLIDFQSLADGSYRYIMHYKEHLTKFSLLRPLTSKRAAEVAKELFGIFSDFGAPHVLQSDNGREFTANIIKELATLWQDLVLVNGRPRHPQSQGCVERSNSSVKDSLIAWMRDNKTSSWSTGLRYVQWALNTTYHEAIKMQPYKAMFGQTPKFGLRSKVPQEFLKAISNGILEEDVEELLQADQHEETGLAADLQENNETDFESLIRQAKIVINENIEENSIYNNEQADRIEDGALPADLSNTVKRKDNSTSLSEKKNELTEEEEHPALQLRMIAHQSMVKQAKKMVNKSNKILGSLAAGDNVLIGKKSCPCIILVLFNFSIIGISEFDRGKGDPANLIGVVMEEKDGKFKVGTKHGIIDTWLERNCLQSTRFNKIQISDVPNNVSNIRSLVRMDSVGSGQGYQRCNCTRGCNSNKCKCVKNKYSCNSACHAGKSCNNHE